MARYKVIVDYTDGSRRTFETTDGPKAMQECASGTYTGDGGRTVSLEKDGETIWSESISPPQMM